MEFAISDSILDIGKNETIPFDLDDQNILDTSEFPIPNVNDVRKLKV